MVKGLIVTHGELARVLIEECKRIMGEVDQLMWLSTHQLSAVDITAKVKEFIKDEPWIVFVDSPGTAPALRSRVALKPGQAVVTGVNLPMLLSFLVHRESLSVEELARKLVNDGIRTLEVLWQLPENGPAD